MTSTKPLYGRHLSISTANEFHLAMTEGAHEDIMRILFEDPDTSGELERGVICVITRSSGSERVSYLVHEVLEPEVGDVTYGGSVQFNRDFRHRAIEKARELGPGAGIQYVHTHPNLTKDEKKWPNPSNGDLKAAEEDLFQDACRLGEDVPLGIAIVKDNFRKWRVIGYEFDTPDTVDEREKPAYSKDSARYYDADCVRVVGESIAEHPTTKQTQGVAGAVGTIDDVTQESSINLFGSDGQERLNALRVGLVGAGGGGSILAEHLSRMGVGEVVIVDYDRLEPANLNRAQGATEADVDAGRPKVDIAARLSRLGATAPGFQVDPIKASVTEHRREHGAAHRLLDCDVLLHAAENEWPTRVLDEIAHSHLIPVISGGSNLLNESGVLTEKAYAQNIIAGPGHLCQHCARHWTRDGANTEMEDPDAVGDDGYNVGLDPDAEREPSTNAINLVVAGQMLLRLQDLVLGVSSHQNGIRRFLPGTWDMEKGIPSCYDDCPMKKITARGDTYQLTLSSDPHFAKQRSRWS